MTKEEPRSPYLPPTPSPSPPTHQCAKLYDEAYESDPHAQPADGKLRHLDRAHTAARQVQLDLLSNAQLGNVGGLTGPSHVKDTQGNQLLRYTLEVEAIERGEKVKKRVSVLFPRRCASENVSQATGSASGGSVASTRISTMAPRYPLARTLSLLPPPRRLPSFRSTVPNSHTTVQRPRNGAPLELVAAVAAVREDEPAPPVSERTAAWARERQEECAKRKRLREVLSEGTAGSDGRGGGGAGRACGEEGEAKRRRRCLCERRGREVSRLVADLSKL